MPSSSRITRRGFSRRSFVAQIGALARRAGKIVTVDPNPRNDLRWTGVTAIKPNRIEAFHVLGLPPTETAGPVADDPLLRRAGELLLAKVGHGDAAHHPGRTGHAAVPARTARRTPSPPCRREVFDLSGAGDTAIALFTLALAAGASPEQAAEVGSHAASVVVGKLGTATLTPQELIASFARSH